MAVFQKVILASLIWLGVLGLTACEETGAPPPQGGSQIYQGVLETGFEVNAFHPENGEGPWWFSADSKVWDELDQRDETGNADLQFYTAEISFRGRLDMAGGRFGHMGAYPAEIRALELETLRYLDREEAEALVTSYKGRLTPAADR